MCVYIYIYIYTHILEKEMATHSSTLAWKIPWTEEPGRLQSMGTYPWVHINIYIDTHTYIFSLSLLLESGFTLQGLFHIYTLTFSDISVSFLNPFYFLFFVIVLLLFIFYYFFLLCY